MRPALHLLFLAPFVLAAEDSELFEFEMTLRDGSRLIGTVEIAELKVQTEFGTRSVPFHVLRRIEFEEQEQQFRYLLRNDDVVRGTPKLSAVQLHSIIGELTIPFSKVSSVDVTPPVSEAAPSLADGLQIHWTFDQKEGDQITNQTGRTPPATLVDGTRVDGAIVLDGASDHAALPNHEVFENTNQFTISIWTKLRSFGPGGHANEHGYLVNKGDDMWWNPAWSLGYSKKSGVGRGVDGGPNPALFTIGTEQIGGQSKCRVETETKLEVGIWYHLVGTYDGSEARIYLNGRLEDQRPYIGKLRRDKAPLLLGGGKLGGTSFGNNFTTDATIDNLRFYNRVLNPGEIRLLHRSEKQPLPKDAP